MELITRWCYISTNSYVIWSKTGQRVAESTDEVGLYKEDMKL